MKLQMKPHKSVKIPPFTRQGILTKKVIDLMGLNSEDLRTNSDKLEGYTENWPHIITKITKSGIPVTNFVSTLGLEHNYCTDGCGDYFKIKCGGGCQPEHNFILRGKRKDDRAWLTVEDCEVKNQNKKTNLDLLLFTCTDHEKHEIFKYSLEQTNIKELYPMLEINFDNVVGEYTDGSETMDVTASLVDGGALQVTLKLEQTHGGLYEFVIVKHSITGNNNYNLQKVEKFQPKTFKEAFKFWRETPVSNSSEVVINTPPEVTCESYNEVEVNEPTLIEEPIQVEATPQMEAILAERFHKEWDLDDVMKPMNLDTRGIKDIFSMFYPNRKGDRFLTFIQKFPILEKSYLNNETLDYIIADQICFDDGGEVYIVDLSGDYYKYEDLTDASQSLVNYNIHKTSLEETFPSKYLELDYALDAAAEFHVKEELVSQLMKMRGKTKNVDDHYLLRSDIFQLFVHHTNTEHGPLTVQGLKFINDFFEGSFEEVEAMIKVMSPELYKFIVNHPHSEIYMQAPSILHIHDLAKEFFANTPEFCEEWAIKLICDLAFMLNKPYNRLVKWHFHSF